MQKNSNNIDRQQLLAISPVWDTTREPLTELQVTRAQKKSLCKLFITEFPRSLGTSIYEIFQSFQQLQHAVSALFLSQSLYYLKINRICRLI